MTELEFSNLALRPEIHNSLQKKGFAQQTPVQALSLPVILSGRDVTAQAQTGSGKTAAFGIGLLNKLNEKSYVTQALVICPTRELADQVAEELRSLAKSIGNVKLLVLCGGKPLGSQLASLKRQPHVVVGTPGRLLQLLQKEALSLAQLETLVLDEADRMLDMGFSEDIDSIVQYSPKTKQTLLFSATYPEEIQSLSSQYQSNAAFVKVETQNSTFNIRQTLIASESAVKAELLAKVLDTLELKATLVFCNTIKSVTELSSMLLKSGFHALPLHGDLEQFKRDQTLVRFSNGSCSVLVATDVAARGIDIKELPLVINFEMPRDKDVYTHRIGRTGRAGSKGHAISFYSKREESLVKEIEAQFETEILDKSELRSSSRQQERIQPAMATLLISGGRKQKLRAGDLVGTLTKQLKISGEAIGKIDVLEKVSYVAIQRQTALLSFEKISSLIVKNKAYRVRLLR